MPGLRSQETSFAGPTATDHQLTHLGHQSLQKHWIPLLVIATIREGVKREIPPDPPPLAHPYQQHPTATDRRNAIPSVVLIQNGLVLRFSAHSIWSWSVEFKSEEVEPLFCSFPFQVPLPSFFLSLPAPSSAAPRPGVTFQPDWLREGGREPDGNGKFRVGSIDSARTFVSGRKEGRLSGSSLRVGFVLTCRRHAMGSGTLFAAAAALFTAFCLF